MVGLSVGRDSRGRTEASVEELGLLARSAGATVVGSLIQQRSRRDPATLIGRGKVQDVTKRSEESGADLLLFDDELTPAQQRNLEEALQRKTLDRTQLILDIFAHRAKSREGRLQVELAQLDYLLPRLSGKGILLSRLGGGIGTRGPGETKLETDRRRIRDRISVVKRQIERVRTERSTRRQGRRRLDTPVVALVGYTNAGKSTLFNALTESGAEAGDELFMTLDPLVRQARLGAQRRLLLVDTVGFIQKLPHSLVAAFRATLEEIVEADLLLHVMDASAEDLDERERAVSLVLEEIGASGRPRIDVLNKADHLAPAREEALREARPGAAVISSLTGEGLDSLRELLIAKLELSLKAVRLRLKNSRDVAAVYRLARVLSHEVQDGDVVLDVEMPERHLERYRSFLA